MTHDNVPFMSAISAVSPYRVVATDLDGTLLRSDGTVSPFTRATVREIADFGVTIVLVTARPIEATAAIATELNASAAICLSGAATYDTRNGDIWDVIPMPPARIERLHNMVKPLCGRVSWAYETTRARYLEPRWAPDGGGLSRERPMRRLSSAGRIPGEEVLSVLATCTAHSSLCLQDWLDDVGEEWGSRFSPVEGIIEVTARDATKKAALVKLCRQRGVRAREVIAFGDNLNDAGMLTWAGTGVAMMNAVADLREVARMVTEQDNDADGVARTLRTLLGQQGMVFTAASGPLRRSTPR